MTDKSSGTLSGKIKFGVDYLNLMRFMEIPRENEESDKERVSVVDAAIILFLLQWDFTVMEIDEANRVYFEKVNSKSLDEDIFTVMDRIADFLKDVKKDQEKFLIEMTAIAQMDETVLADESSIPRYFQSKFDLRPSEMELIIKKGWSWRLALDFFGKCYTEYMNLKAK